MHAVYLRLHTHTYSEYAVPLQQRLYEHASTLRRTYICLSCDLYTAHFADKRTNSLFPLW